MTNLDKYKVNYSPELVKILDEINDAYFQGMEKLEKNNPELAEKVKKYMAEYILELIYGDLKC